MTDIVLSSGWRTGQDAASHVHPDSVPVASSSPQDGRGDRFISRHGRYEVTITAVPSGWKVTYTSTGRLFGPRVCIYEAVHAEPRHAAWDVMCRVMRATDDEEVGVLAGKHASAWLMEHMTIC